MRHYKVTRLNEVSGRAVLQGSCDAESPEDAVRKIAYASRLSPTLLRAEDIGPARNP